MEHYTYPVSHCLWFRLFDCAPIVHLIEIKLSDGRGEVPPAVNGQTSTVWNGEVELDKLGIRLDEVSLPQSQWGDGCVSWSIAIQVEGGLGEL